MSRTARYPVACFLALLLAGCWAIPDQAEILGLSEDEGEVLVYLEAFSPDAERIKFALAAMSAEREDGTLVPLLLRKREFGGTDIKRQRLVAGGRLKPGRYSGFSFVVKSAVLRGEDGDAVLLVPEQPVRKHAPFWIEKERTLVISLVFNFRDSFQSGYRFSPVFQSFQPERPLVGLTGYVTNRGSGTITVFDKKRMVVTGVLNVGGAPNGMVVDPLFKRAYVTLPDEDSVVVVDMASGQEVNRIVLLRGDNPQDLIMNSRGDTLLTVNAGSNSVSVIDPDAGLETTRITLSDTGQSGRVSYAGAGSILLDRSGIKAYVLNAVSNCISIIDIPNRALVATVATESVPLQAEFNKKGDRLYMIYDGSPYLNVLDPGTLFSIKKAYVGMQPAAIKVDTNTDMVYVARKREAEVSVYDPFSLLPVESIKAESSSDFMTIDNESNNLLLLSFKDETVTAVQLNSKNILSAIQIGKSPYRVRVIGER